MKITLTPDADTRVIVDGDNEGATEIKAGEAATLEGQIIQLRELGVGVTDADFYQAPPEVSGD